MEEGFVIDILMCAPAAQTGGVAIHTANLIKQLQRKNIKVIFYNTSGNEFHRWLTASFGSFLKILIIRKKCDLIHVQMSRGLFSLITGLFCYFGSIVIGAPIVFTYHNSVITHKKLMSILLNSSDHFILVTDISNKNNIINKYAEKITIISNGFDPEAMSNKDMVVSRSDLGLPIEKKIILSIGNLLEVKGHIYLIDSINIMKSNNILSLIIGDGPLKSQLLTRIDSLNLDDKIRLVGQQPHNDISRWISASDIVVLPSLSEGNPTVMFEALGCGKPFIGTRVGGVPEVITSDDYGLLVEPANPEDLAEKIMIALDREWDQKKILDYAAQYTWENIAKQIMGVYERVLKETP